MSTHHVTDQVLSYVERGWYVLPLVPGQKVPRLHDWRRRSTNAPDVVARWWNPSWTKMPGVGIDTGRSGLVVVDCDVKLDESNGEVPIDGRQEWALLQATNGLHGPTLSVNTPSGGRHYYFEAPESRELRNTAGKLGPGIDTRSVGGYVVAPPTGLANGSYTVFDSSDPAPLPIWAFEALKPRPASSVPPKVLEMKTEKLDRYVGAALAGETQRVRLAREGQRNRTLFTSAACLGQLVGAGVLPEDHARAAMVEAYSAHVAVGADSWKQANKTITNGLTVGKQTPRQLPGSGTPGVGRPNEFSLGGTTSEGQSP